MKTRYIPIRTKFSEPPPELRIPKFLIIIIILYIIIMIPFYFYLEHNQEPNWCELYEEQELIMSRIHYTGQGEQEYQINGTWINNSVLEESCEKNNRIWK